jgi:hypothetical protein
MKKISIIVIGMFLAIALGSSLSASADPDSAVLPDLKISLIYMTHGPNNHYHTCWTYTKNAGPGTAENPNGFYTTVWLNHDHEPYISSKVGEKEYTVIGPYKTKLYAPTFYHNHIPDEWHSCTGVADDGDRVEEWNEDNNWKETGQWAC